MFGFATPRHYTYCKKYVMVVSGIMLRPISTIHIAQYIYMYIHTHPIYAMNNAKYDWLWARLCRTRNRNGKETYEPNITCVRTQHGLFGTKHNLCTNRVRSGVYGVKRDNITQIDMVHNDMCIRRQKESVHNHIMGYTVHQIEPIEKPRAICRQLELIYNHRMGNKANTLSTRDVQHQTNEQTYCL